MRELVYLSEAKLQQFAAGQAPRWGDRAEVEAEFRIPGVGGLTVRPKDAGTHLDKVIAELENSDRASRWFTDDDVRPGEWIQFEAPLSYTTMHDAVIFLDLDRPTEAYPTGGAIRLMLYGSQEHLIGGSPTRIVEREVARRLGVSYLPVHRMMARLAEEDTTRPPMRLANLVRILAVLGDHVELADTATWMAGHARVTAVTGTAATRAVVATPLYVQYGAAPR